VKPRVRRLLPALLVSVGLAGASLSIASCSAVANERIGIVAPPFSQATFQPVGDYLVWRCGTGDCHGAVGRNFRVFGCDGVRLDAGQTVSCVPDDAGAGPTSIYEYQATYRSMVALEPQVMTTVWEGCKGSGGAYPPPESCHPELLTMMQKARGTEKHKGGQLICLTPPCPPGITPPNPTATPPVYDQQDQCLVTWLEGDVDVTACNNATFTYGLPAPDASDQ